MASDACRIRAAIINAAGRCGSFRKLADSLGVTESAIAHFRSGRRRPGPSILFALGLADLVSEAKARREARLRMTSPDDAISRAVFAAIKRHGTETNAAAALGVTQTSLRYVRVGSVTSPGPRMMRALGFSSERAAAAIAERAAARQHWCGDGGDRGPNQAPDAAALEEIRGKHEAKQPRRAPVAPPCDPAATLANTVREALRRERKNRREAWSGPTTAIRWR